MKTLADVQILLQAFEKRFGMPVLDAQQGSDRWLQMRLGVITGSNAHRAVSKADSDTRATYMASLVAGVCTGVTEEINSKHMEWGKDQEPAARSSYEFAASVTIDPLCFVYKDDTFRTGCSPDGIVTPTRGCEIKCPWDSTNYVKFLTEDKIKPEYVWQYQFTLWVMDAVEWDFVQYDPRMRKNALKILKVEKDPAKFKTFEDAVPQFIHDMDKMLAQCGFEFGEHWARLGQLA